MTGAELESAVLALEDSGGRAVTHWDPSPDERGMARVLASCATALMRTGDGIASDLARVAKQQGVPMMPIARLSHDLLRGCRRQAPYAFMAVRIHDDFALVRHALATAVEAELGMPCVYFEDTRVAAGPCGARERTAELIRGASFFVADLSRSASSPKSDSPNTAHEVGMAQALGVPLVLCAQAPRRDLYFLAGDMETLFWRDEADLHHRLRRWLQSRRSDLGCRVLANDLPRSRFRSSPFVFDPALRYLGPPSLLRRASTRLVGLVTPGVPDARWLR